jgi:hypothetical protein
MNTRTLFVVAPIIALAAIATTSAQGQTSQSVEELLTRVGERIAEYYKRAQSLVCVEKSTVQQIGFNYSPEGFARTVESELHVEADGGDTPGEAKVVREIRKINGRVPRERDKKDREGCTDPNPLSPEPLAFLLPAHRGEYAFSAAGIGKEQNRQTLLIDFASANKKGRLELQESSTGRPDCFTWSGDAPIKGRVWVDAITYEVLRVDSRFSGPVDIRVSDALQRKHSLSNWMVVERLDETIRYKKATFRDPDEAMLLPD